MYLIYSSACKHLLEAYSGILANERWQCFVVQASEQPKNKKKRDVAGEIFIAAQKLG